MSEEVGLASYYTNKSVDPRWGGYTKSGEMFDENDFTAAVPPKRWKELRGKKLEITSVDTGKKVVVRVNDTGGFEKYGRAVDLSKAAFGAIAPLGKGLTKVKIKVVKEPE